MFDFFKVVPINKKVKNKSKIISYCNNSTYKVFCNIDDEVHIFWNDWESLTLQMKNLKLCCIPEDSNNIILLSQHTITRKIYINVYNISTEEGRKIATLISKSILESNNKVTSLSSINFSESKLLLSIGLDNGNIFLFKNTLQKEIPANAFKYFNVTTKPIKGIKFSENKENIIMFVCSDSGVFCYTVSSNLKLIEAKVILDDMDSSVHCITLKPSSELSGEQYLVVAREDGLYFYTAEGRGPCYAINGFKQSVEWFGKQLVIVLKTKAGSHLNRTISQVLIYDIVYKIIVLNKELDEVVCLLPISGHSNCLFIQQTGDILTLREHELRYKLTYLIKKKLYDIALKILEESKAKIDYSDILVQYGDYLLQRGDSSGAIVAYSKTIGITPPFLIINKLMDFRYNEFLKQYLCKLVQTEFTLPEYLKLLNNCFRRKDLPKSAFRVFEIENCNFKQLYIDYETINHNSNVSLVITNLKQNSCISLGCLHEYSNAEIIKFLSEYGYFFVKEYSYQLKELAKYSLSDRYLKNNMFNRILLPLSLMNKLYALYFIDDLIRDCEKHSIFNILTELVLQLWYKGHIDTKFVIDFFKSHQPENFIDTTFIICRHFEFWPGIKMMYDNCSMEILSTHCLAKCFETFPEYVNNHSHEYSSTKLNQMIVALKKRTFETYNTLKYVIDIVINIMTYNPSYILNILNNFVTCSDFLLLHLDKLLVQGKFLTYFKCDELNGVVSFLENQLNYMEYLVYNYLRRPIEFRNRSCDICKQIMKQPSVVFLCQHSFHRECFIQFSENFVCIVCKNVKKS